MLSELEIHGLRGFASKQKIKFSIPNQSVGSGLTILVGANNSGKSTIIEAIRALCQRREDPPSFTQGRRNQRAGDAVEMILRDELGNETKLESISKGSSETRFTILGAGIATQKVVILPSRRTFNPYFSRGSLERSQYMSHIGFPTIRSSEINQFSNRLFTALDNKLLFNEVLKRVLSPVPEWTIDQMDTGQHYLKIVTGDSAHSSEGLGEGLVSLFFIIDALYDSNDGDTIIIDEPELSLHPMLQRKLSDLFVEYARSRQIVLATHSPYFINPIAISNGSTVGRTYQKNGETQISQLSADTLQKTSGFFRNYNNPHIFGLKAQEVFFLEDNVILVEGQEDVIFYQLIEEQVDEKLEGTFFGWGVGGASNMPFITQILLELGFKKVVGILDGDKKEVEQELASKYPSYRFFTIPANDIRTKQGRSLPEVYGLLDEKRTLREEYIDTTKQIFQSVNGYLKS